MIANDEDPDASAVLRVVTVDQAVNGEVTLQDGKVLFTPKQNYFGQASFRYIVSDGQGGFSESVAKINITAVNDAPNRVDRGFAAIEDTPFRVSIGQLLSGVTDIDGDAVSFVRVKDARGGTLTQSGTDIIFTPASNAVGAAYFAYEVADAKGAVTTSFVTMNINNVNDTPELIPGVSLNFEGQEDTPIHISKAAILGLYADPDVASGDVLSIAQVTAKSAGDTVSYDAVTGEILYTPLRNANGARSLEVRVQDKAGAYIDTTFSVNVTAVNDAPSVGAVGFSMLEDGGTTDSSKQAISYLYHDTILNGGTIYDIDGDALSIIEVRNGKTADGQAVQVNNYTGSEAGDNRISILAPLNYNGAVSFEFKVSDGRGGETWQTAYGKVEAVNDLPDITPVYLGSHTRQQAFSSFANNVTVFNVGMPREYYRLDIHDVEDGSLFNPVADRYPLQSKVHQGETWGIAQYRYDMNSSSIWQQATYRSISYQTIIKTDANYFGIENWIVGGASREESVTFKVTDSQGGTSYKTVTFWAHGYDPVVIDLGNDGLEFIDAADSKVMVDRDGDGVMQKIAWIKPSEGILAWDHNLDGVINRMDEIEFWSHINPQVQDITDLQALAKPEFDSNQDGKFDTADSKWAEFKLWQDKNSNGVSDAGELQTLTEAGIKTLYLSANILNRSYGEDVLVRGYTRVEMTDGRLLQAGDVQLNALPSDWVPEDNNSNSEQQTAGLISATDAQAEFSALQTQPSTRRDGSPDFTGGLGAHKVLTNAAYHYVMPADLFQSLQSDAQITVKQINGQALPIWLSFDVASRTLSGTPSEGQLGEWLFKVSAVDSQGNLATGVMQLTVADRNQAPIVYGNMPAQFVSENEFLELNVAPNFFIDRDFGDQISYSVTLNDGSPLPDWLHFDTKTLRLFGTPGAEDVGTIDLRLSAKDEANAAAHAGFKVIVSAINDALVLANPVASISLIANIPNTYTLPADLFVDPDIGDQIVITATLVDGQPLPDWLHFDATTLTFAATPTTAQLATLLMLRQT